MKEQKIVRLCAENILRLKAVEITPEGNLVTIGGKNAQGKTSVLECIAMALGGKARIPERPIHGDEEEGFVVLELDDLIVRLELENKYDEEKNFKEVGAKLVVTSKEGARFPSPQTMLDKMYGALTFDPLEFTRSDGKTQVKILQGFDPDLAGALDKMRAARQALYDDRTLAGRNLKSLQARLTAMPVYTDVPDEEVTPAATLEAIQKATRTNNTRVQLINHAELCQRHVEEAKERQQRAVRTVKELQKKVMEAEQALEKAEADLEDCKQQVTRSIEESKEADLAVKKAPAEVDLSTFQSKLDGAEEVNRKVRENKARESLKIEVADREAELKTLTGEIQDIDIKIEEALAGSKLPVKGLSFTEDGLLFKGVPFEQASAAEQLAVSLEIGIAQHPQLKVMLIRDGSLLDSKSKEAIAARAAKEGIQVWMEEVAEPDKNGNYPEGISVVIEDGSVLQKTTKKGKK